MSLADDPETLSGLVTALGGTVIPGPSFRFELPLSQVREVVPKINKLGLGCRKVAEHTDDDPTRAFGAASIATLELYRPNAEKEYRLPEGF
jgi:hypothetical protein